MLNFIFGFGFTVLGILIGFFIGIKMGFMSGKFIEKKINDNNLNEVFNYLDTETVCKVADAYKNLAEKTLEDLTNKAL